MIFCLERWSAKSLGKAVKQRRDAITDNVYRVVSEVVYMNKVRNEGIQFVMNFTDDDLDREAAR